MARIDGIKKRLAENGIDEKLTKQITGGGNLVNVIEQMEKLLDPEVTGMILESSACTGGKKYLALCEKIGREMTGLSLEEKIQRLNRDSDSVVMAVNGDSTLTVTMSFMKDGKYGCACSAAVKDGVRVSDLALADDGSGSRVMPLTYCRCCAGGNRLHSQLQLGVALKTKEIVSSPINSGGEKPCKFVFEITDIRY